jgi:acyl-CoA synthetase (AMP-forming)/AMP-acid ligase II
MHPVRAFSQDWLRDVKDSLAFDSVQSVLAERARTGRPWIVRPHDAVKSATATTTTFASTYEQALECARRLTGVGSRGAPVMIIFENGPEFAAAFFGVLLAGMIPVPFPPRGFTSGGRDEYQHRLALVSRDCQPSLILVSGSAQAKFLEQLPNAPPVHCLAELMCHSADPLDPCWSSPADTALIQYTSGSTGNPRGVELSHGNLLANVAAIGAAVSASGDDVGVSWLPLFHDMGLIGSFLFTLGWGMPFVLLTPREFMLKPASWLWAISRFRGTLSPAPNFAFRLCVSRVPDASVAGLDLSSWRVAFNGAETVQVATLRDFVDRYRAMGLRENAIWPVYGLAENALAVSFPDPRAPLVVDRLDRNALENERRAAPAELDSTVREVVGVGRPLTGQRVRIRGPEGGALLERCVGEIEVSGPCVMKGYYGNPGATADALGSDGWLRTGDIGYLADGALFVVGRHKNVIKRHGAGLDAADIEAAAMRVLPKSSGCVAAFGTVTAETGTENLVLAVETAHTQVPELHALKRTLAETVMDRCRTRPDEIIFVKPRTIPRTTSGKVRHAETRRRYLEGLLARVEAGVDGA